MSGIRYSEKEKAKILNFIEQWDKDHGRGGKLQAFKKFKVSPLTLRTWIAEQGKKPFIAEPTTFVKSVSSAKALVQVSDLKEKVSFHMERIERYSSQIAELKAKVEKEKEAISKVLE